MSHFGDLLKGGGIKDTPTPQPVVEKPAQPAPPAPVVEEVKGVSKQELKKLCLLYTSPIPPDLSTSRMPS